LPPQSTTQPAGGAQYHPTHWRRRVALGLRDYPNRVLPTPTAVAAMKVFSAPPELGAMLAAGPPHAPRNRRRSTPRIIYGSSRSARGGGWPARAAKSRLPAAGMLAGAIHEVQEVGGVRLRRSSGRQGSGDRRSLQRGGAATQLGEAQESGAAPS
jgi:hypothetical protein